MLALLGKRLFGSVNDRILKPFYGKIAIINSLEPEIAALSDIELAAKTAEFRSRLEKGETLDSVLPQAFAVVREAAKRTIGLRPYDVQLLGGMVLHNGMISEMKTGEGKTLVATLPVYLNAIEGKGVHVVTVNDYLARRDSEWMGKIYRFLGLSVSCLVHGLDDEERREAYNSDILYGTNNEFGFDYLRDNLKFSRSSMVQRKFNYAIVDEVDSILIDEARTPLIISGPTEDNSELYVRVNKLVERLSPEDYEKDEKSRTVVFTEAGTKNIEDFLKEAGMLEAEANLYDMESISLVHHANQALRAHHLFTKDVDYIVKDGKVVIIDEFTGRMQEGRRFSEGLHQALEAKEGVRVQNENQTLASITFQNYFRLYPKLAGMTGTAMTEASELRDIYKLEVVEIPTHVPVSRKDEDDEIYRTSEEKYEAIMEAIEESHKRKQPVLVGTVSIEKSELLSSLLKKRKIPHNVLNARYHEQEAQIIAQAGRPGAVTIATNMAGRGTDIMLGGNWELRALQETAKITDEAERKRITENIKQEVERAREEVLEAGGLFVLGTERHESRRIDNQLRGRSGRQGDPGRSRFYLSLQDDLMRIFGSERIDGMLVKMGLKQGEAITHPWVSKALEKAQKKVEGRNYEIRKNVLKFDDVMSDQRKVIYEQRLELMETDDVSETIQDMRASVVEDFLHIYVPERSYPEQWELEKLKKEILRIFGLDLPVAEWGAEEGIADKEILERILKEVNSKAEAKEKTYGAEIMRDAEKRVLMLSLDQLWKEHLHSLDHLRQGINLRAYGQKDPLNEYKNEAFRMFDRMLSALREIVTQRLSHLEIRTQEFDDFEDLAPNRKMFETRIDPAMAGEEDEEGAISSMPLRTHVAPENRDPHNPETWGKVSRNEACPCGSGQKYKHCHGKLA